MDFYTNIHKSRGDRGSSITASSDTVSPSIIQPGEAGPRPAAAAPSAGPAVGEGSAAPGEGQREHYLLEVFKFIARMMFLISTAAIN